MTTEMWQYLGYAVAFALCAMAALWIGERIARTVRLCFWRWWMRQDETGRWDRFNDVFSDD